MNTSKVGEDVEKGDPLTLSVGMQAGTLTLKNSMDAPQDVYNRAIPWANNCTTRYSSLRYKCTDPKGHLHPNVHNSQTVGGAEMSLNRWMDKEDVVHIHNGISLSHQKGWIPTICINMDGTGRDYSKWNKSIRERQLSYYFTHMWNIRNSAEDNRGMGGTEWEEIREGDKP